MRGEKILIKILICCSLIWVSQNAFADRDYHEGERRHHREMSIDDAAAAAEHRYPGSRVLRAEHGGEYDKVDSRMYEIRVLTPNGRVRNMVVDPESGKISE